MRKFGFKKPVSNVCGAVLAALALSTTGFVACNKDTASVEKNFLPEKLKNEFDVKELDAGDFAKIKVSAMKFTVNHYDVSGCGHLVVMQGVAMFGLMKMDTVVFTPTTKDAPLFSYDRIKAMGNDTLILELYDTLLDENLAGGYAKMKSVKERLSEIGDHDLGEHWYDNMKMPATFAKKGKKCGKAFDSAYAEFFNQYLDCLSKSPDCDKASKNEKSAVYVNGLLDNGGPSTDAFIKAVGRDATEKFYHEIMFGIGR